VEGEQARQGLSPPFRKEAQGKPRLEETSIHQAEQSQGMCRLRYQYSWYLPPVPVRTVGM